MPRTSMVAGVSPFVRAAARCLLPVAEVHAAQARVGGDRTRMREFFQQLAQRRNVIVALDHHGHIAKAFDILFAAVPVPPFFPATIIILFVGLVGRKETVNLSAIPPPCIKFAFIL